MSLPSAPDHSIISSTDAGRPMSSFAPHMAVAALAEPPPRPAWAGTCLIRLLLKYIFTPVFSRISSRALNTRLVESTGTPGMLQVNSSASPSSNGESSRVSPNPIAWKRLARSWKPSSRFRMIRRNKLILQGLKSLSAAFGSSDDEPNSDVCFLDRARAEFWVVANPCTNVVVTKQKRKQYQMQREEILYKLDMVFRRSFQ
mmetsp:Transcript_8931/g.18550  ORF Transcript_8931/g.18550 Transcript_8931/m.18550 type:complete len:201 (-) Transcript_8931:51-653(-)